MSVASILKVYDGQEPDLCFGVAPGPGGVNSVGVGAGLVNTGSAANPVVSLGMSAVGDLLVGTGVANSGAVLGKGANGQFLRVKNDGTGLEYAAVAPGGVDSVSAVANNVGLVLTTAPATPADPKIGLAFSAKADIPVGTAASTGVMVSAPLPLTTGLVLQTDTTAPSGVKWAPAAGPTGIITTLAPLKDDYSAPNNTISIDFTTAQGEIPYGIGTAETGALLAPPTDAGAVGKVLTYNGIVQGQPAIGWTTPTTPVGGDTIILHTNAGTNLVPVPTDQNTSLILVAGELQASWDKLVLNLPAVLLGPYAPELLIKSNAALAQEYLAVSLEGGPNGRVVELYDMTGAAAPYRLGIFSFVNSLGSPDADAQVCCYCNGDDPHGGPNFFVGTSIAGNILIGGKFNRYNDIAGNAANPFGICQLTNIGAGLPAIEYIYNSGQAQLIFGFTNSNDPVNDTTTTIYTIAGFPANALSGLASIPVPDGPQTPLQYPGVLIGGTFDTIHQTDNTGQPDDIQGFGGLAIMYAQPSPGTIEVLLPGPCKEYGLWVSKFVESVTTTCLIAVRKIVWLAGYDDFAMCGSDFVVLALNNDGSGTQLFLSLQNTNSAGFCYYSAGPTAQLPGSTTWDQNDNPVGNQPLFDTNNAYDIAISSALAGHIIINGSLGVAFVDVSVPAAWVWTASVAQGVSVGGYLNSILTNQAVTTPAGLITGDWVLGTGATSQIVGYITTAGGAIVTSLNPDPTGVLPCDIEGIPPSYGLQRATNSLLIAGKDVTKRDTIYQYDSNVHPTITFTTTPPMFWKDPIGTGGLTNAIFGTAYQSQSYIASSDKAFWIQVGANSANLTYS